MTYSGNKLVNINTFFAIVCLPLLLIVLPINENTWLIIPAVVSLVYFLYFREAFYFAIEGNVLVVRNIAWPFLNRQYNLSEIENIAILDKGIRTFSKAKLRINLKGETSKTYKAASLRIEDWRLFIRGLQRLNIKIDVEPYQLKSSPDEN